MIIPNARPILRPLIRRPWLTLARVVLVAMLVGVGSAVYAVANATLLRPLRLPESSRLARIVLYPPGVATRDGGTPMHVLSYSRLREQAAAFELFEGVWTRERALGGEGEPESVAAVSASAGALPLLGAGLQAGRTFDEKDTQTNAKVVVLSHALWVRRFGASPAAIGQTLLIDRQSHEIIGVLSPRFSPRFIRGDVWTPLYLDPADRLNRLTYIQHLGRLRHGVSFADAEAQMRAALAVVALEAPVVLKDWTLTVQPLQENLFGNQRPAIVLLLLAVAALALLGTANLANLTLADVMTRQREFAARLALGANLRQIVLPEVVRSLAVAIVAGALGLLFAQAMLPTLLTLAGDSLANADVVIGPRVVAAMLLFSFAVMLAATALPLRRLLSVDLQKSLIQSGRGATGSRESMRLRTTLVATQTALGVVLLSITAVVLGGFARAARVDPGFEAAGLAGAQLQLPERTYATLAARGVFVNAVVEEVRAIPGVRSAAAAGTSLIPNFAYQTLAEVEGQPNPTGQPHTLLFRRISDRYFATMGIDLLAGREFDARDTAEGQLVAIVNSSFARRFWPGQDALGRRVRRATANPTWLIVVGVVDDAFENGFGQPARETLYVPYAQNNTAGVPVTVVVRTGEGGRVSAADVAAAVRRVDPLQPVAKVMDYRAFLEESLSSQRFRTLLLAALAALALAITAVGTYGVTARSVGERTREIGVRMALGGTRRGVWWRTGVQSLRAVVYGCIVGTIAALASAPALTSVVPDVRTGAAIEIAGALALLVLVASAAAFGASLRAARLSPLDAIRASE